MIISGQILYIAPPGRIAKWDIRTNLGLEKEGIDAGAESSLRKLGQKLNKSPIEIAYIIETSKMQN
jgi:hypothetical protein